MSGLSHLKDVYEDENVVLTVKHTTILYVTPKNGSAMMVIEVKADGGIVVYEAEGRGAACQHNGIPAFKVDN